MAEFVITVNKNGVGTFLNAGTGNSFQCKLEEVKNGEVRFLKIVSQKKDEAKEQPAPAPVPVVAAEPHRVQKARPEWFRYVSYGNDSRRQVTEEGRGAILLFKAKHKLQIKDLAQLCSFPPHIIHCCLYHEGYRILAEYAERLENVMLTFKR